MPPEFPCPYLEVVAIYEACYDVHYSGHTSDNIAAREVHVREVMSEDVRGALGA